MTKEQMDAAQLLKQRTAEFNEARQRLGEAAKHLRELMRTKPELPALLRKQVG